MTIILASAGHNHSRNSTRNSNRNTLLTNASAAEDPPTAGWRFSALMFMILVEIHPRDWGRKANGSPPPPRVVSPENGDQKGYGYR